jgi:hypothetical protein
LIAVQYVSTWVGIASCSTLKHASVFIGVTWDYLAFFYLLNVLFNYSGTAQNIAGRIVPIGTLLCPDPESNVAKAAGSFVVVADLHESERI